MNIKLHNKFEITLNNKTYTLYNTLLDTIYEKISNLEQYTSHIAIGTGTSEKTTTDTKLGNYLMTFKATTDEIQSDVSKGTLFIKKVVTLDETNTNTFSFSELGITNTNSFDPTIFDHVLLKNQDGEVISITRNQGEVMEIKVTIYLELSEESKKFFIQGENDLIKRFLGEELNELDNNLYIVRGENILPDNALANITYDLTKAFACKKENSTNSDGTININYNAELGEGDTEEILLLFNNTVCLKLNTLEFNTPTEQSVSSTCSNGNYIYVDKNVQNVLSVFTGDETGSEHTSHTVVKYGNSLSTKVTSLFDQNFDSSVPRYVSKDGKLIAFIFNSYVHLYKYSNYEFTKINTINISTSNLKKIVMFEDIVIIFRTSDPYINIYKIENNIAVQKNVNLQMYDASIYSYDWIDVDATLTKNNIIKIGAIINDENQTPIVITLTENTVGTFNDNFTRPTLETARKIYSVYKNNYCEPRIGFISDTYNGGTYYFIEEFLESASQFAASSDTAFGLLNKTTGIKVSGRAVVSEKTNSPYLNVYYYPNFDGIDTSFTSGIKHYFSQDGNYIIAKLSDETYKIYNFHEINKLIEFKNGFPSFVDFSTISDFEFVGDYLLVFTTNLSEPLYFIPIKKTETRIDNLTDNTSSYKINYTKYNLLGSKTLEGVKVNLNIKFTDNN